MTRFVIGNVGVFPFSGSAEVTGNLQVSGAGNHPGAVLEVMGPATGPGLRVTGNAEITGDLLVKGTTVTVDSATNLKVEGELSSSGPLVVTGQSQIKGNLLLSGSSTFAGVLSASNIVASGSAILKDTLKIYVNLALIITGTTLEGVPVLARYNSYPNIDLDFRDFEFHENEEINYNVVSRVFDSLYNLQRNVLDSILNN